MNAYASGASDTKRACAAGISPLKCLQQPYESHVQYSSRKSLRWKS